MRISDWSSDVCSSDLPAACIVVHLRTHVSDRLRREVVAGNVAGVVLGVGRIEVALLDRAGLRVRRIVLEVRQQAGPVEAVVDIATRLVEPRSEEHTSELPSLMRISYAVFCWKNTKTTVTKA